MKWFKLDRFGAKLYVLPKSNSRSRTVLRLEMRNAQSWIAEKKIAAFLDSTVEDRFTPEKFSEALADLGFGKMNSVRLASGLQQDYDLHGPEYTTFAAEAVRDSIKLSELQTLMPGLTTDDVIDMPLEKIVAPSGDFLDFEKTWNKYRGAMVNDASFAWVPVNDTWAKGSEPIPILQALDDAGLGIDREDRDRTLSVVAAIEANKLGYRDDALVTYYVSEEAALADGLKEGQYRRLGYAAAFPILVAGEGKVIALRDIWQMPDFRRTLNADTALRNFKNDGLSLSLVSDFLVERKNYRQELSQSIDRLTQWVANPKLVANESSDLISSQIEVFKGRIELATRFRNLTFDSVDVSAAFTTHENGQLKLKRLVELDNNILEILAQSAANDGAGEKEAIFKTLYDASLIWAKFDFGLGTKGKENDGAKPSTETGVGEKSLTEDADDKRKHKDAGEKIGGARKDYHRNSLTKEDVEQLNELEIKTHVNKQNIWPPLNYAAMREDGIDPVVAMSIKLIKDSINTTPNKKYSSEYRESVDLYIDSVSKIREIFSSVANKEELSAAIKETKDFINGAVDSNIIYGGPIWHQIGKDTSKLLYSCDVKWMAERKIQKATTFWDRDKQAYVSKDPWLALIKERKKSLTDSDLEERKRKAELDKELHMPHLAKVERYGNDWREGRDVVAEDLIEHFGFRAIEYGEWLPQKERQEVINFAYDSFADLAQALNLVPKDVSLGGELSIAFGARGRGGKGAALAHFETERFVLNLTRMNGAGSLAHEWFHALDRKIAIDAGTGLLFGSQAVPGTSVLRSMLPLVNRMKFSSVTADDLTEKVTARAALSRSNAESWLGGIEDTKERGKAKADLDHAMDRINLLITKKIEYAWDRYAHDGTLTHNFSSLGFIDASIVTELADELRDQMQLGFGKILGAKSINAIHGNAYYYASHEGLRQTIGLFKRHEKNLPEDLLSSSQHRVQSVFSLHAEKLDELRSSPYWNTTIELFARAGAAYVQDKLETLGSRNDYLVYGAGDNRTVSDLGVSPNPSGEDRQALAAHFDALLTEYGATLKHAPTVTVDAAP